MGEKRGGVKEQRDWEVKRGRGGREGKWGSVISMNLKMEEREENKRMMYEM